MTNKSEFRYDPLPSRGNNIVILGDGLLGTELNKQTGWKIISRKQHKFDITNPTTWEKYLLEDFDGIAQVARYETIVNCIAHTDVYSKDPHFHWCVNYKGVANLVDFCNKWNIKLIHISTDYVYTNSDSFATEDLTVPIHGNNWYSYTKLLADAYIELKSNDYLICRGTHKTKPFPYPQAWSDQIGNFDYVDVIGKLIIELINKEAIGIYNIGTGIKSMYELALKTNHNITPANKPEYVPTNTSINIEKLKRFLDE